MKKDPKIFIGHIIDSIADIEEYTEGQNLAKFSKTKIVQDAVIRKMEIIGEAVKNLPPSFRKKHPQIEWKNIAGMRDKLVHDYFGINIKVVWKTVKQDIPQLKKQISKLNEDLQEKLPL